MTTKTEYKRQAHQAETLARLGFTEEEATALRRISMTLHRWHELECGTDNGCVERDEETGKTYWRNSMTGKRRPFPDRETGAIRRLSAIIEARNSRSADSLAYYVQGDPRGAALYILRPGDVPKGQDVDAYYNRGICVY
jgi:hypothetical protein